MEEINSSSSQPNKNHTEMSLNSNAVLIEKCADLEQQIGHQKSEVKQLQDKCDATVSHHLETVTLYSQLIDIMLCSVSNENSAAKTMVSHPEVKIFFCVAINALQSYNETCLIETTPEGNPNEHFLLSLCSFSEKMASTLNGTERILNNTYGMEYITAIISILPNIPKRSGDHMILALLRVVYNIGINGGLVMLKKQLLLLEVLSETINRRDHVVADLLPVALQILEMITAKLSFEQYWVIKRFLTPQHFYCHCGSKSAEVMAPAIRIMFDLSDAQDKFDGTSAISILQLEN